MAGVPVTYSYSFTGNKEVISNRIITMRYAYYSGILLMLIHTDFSMLQGKWHLLCSLSVSIFLFFPLSRYP